MQEQRTRITFVGHCSAVDSYGLHSFQIVRDLERLANVYISVRPIRVARQFGSQIPEDISRKFVNGPQPEEWEILLAPPGALPTPGKRVVNFSMWESTKLRQEVVEILNLSEVVIVPSQFCATVFSASGVVKPIRIVPLGINEDVFKPQPWVEGKTVLGCAGRLASGGARKGLNETITAFQKAFPNDEDVLLRVKCFPDCPVYDPKDNRIQITRAYLQESEMADWMGSLTAFISAAKAEGWGLLQHQACRTGRPVATVDFGGICEFFDPYCGYALPFTLEPAEGIYQGCGAWAEPSERGIIDVMRRIHADNAEARDKGLMATMRVAGLSWENSNLKLIEVLEEFGAIPKQRKSVSINAELPAPVQPVKKAFKPTGRTTFRHAGDLGDIIYALPAIRAMGGGDLFIESASYTRQKLTKDRWCGIDLLLKEQPYITSVRPYYGENVAHNLNLFRVTMERGLASGNGHDKSLCDWVLETNGLPLTAKDEPWLTVDPKPVAAVVINRTGAGRPSHQCYHNPAFPWHRVWRKYHDNAVFIGTPAEHELFCKVCGEVPYHLTANLLEAAQVIAGASLFVGNQSVCHSLAQGLFKRVLLEVWKEGQNSSFHRDGVVNALDQNVELPEI